MSCTPEELLRHIDNVKLVKVDPCDHRQGWVYFISCHETGRIKIGFTKGNPFKRLRALQTGCATELAVVAMHPGTPATERTLHDRFEHCRVRGEWFEIRPELSAYIIDTCWAMSEFTLRRGHKLLPWMIAGLEYSLDRLKSLPEGLMELLEKMPG